MTSNKFIGQGLTYDDVLLVPAFSETLPREVSIISRFSRNIPLNIPIVSAAMDTVTESRMAIAMAREGGIGVLHKNMTIEEQATKVRTVKRSESGMIIDPVTLPETALVSDAKENMQQFKIGGIPIVDDQNRLLGIVTNRDLRFENNSVRPIREVMTKNNLITVKEGTSLKDAEQILQKHKIEKLPVVSKDNTLVGLITFRDITKHTTKPNSNKDHFGRLRVAAAVGVTSDVLDRVAALHSVGVDAIVIDTAHGHSKGVAEVLKNVKQQFTGLDVAVGNIATASAAKYLVDLGADAVKVGIGPGSICTTRVVAGIGVPQFSAIVNVKRGLKRFKDVKLIADGGIRYSGDIAKALGAGADAVMIGSLLAGTDETPGEIFFYQGRSYKSYRGMGSISAMARGSADRYFQQDIKDQLKLVPEGVEGRVPYRGPVKNIIEQLVGGLKSSMGYLGAKNLKEFQTNAKFIEISNSGIKEGHVHDVQITKQSPNYPVND